MTRSAAVLVAFPLVLAALACGRGAPIETPRLEPPGGATVAAHAGTAPGACSVDAHAVASTPGPARGACGPEPAVR